MNNDAAFENFRLRIVPWLTDGCVRFMNNLLKWYPGCHEGRMSVLEWGGGNSTIYFMQKGLRVVSVESDIEYVDMLVSFAQKHGYSACAVKAEDYAGAASSQMDLTVVHLPKSYPTALTLEECPEVSTLLESEAWSIVINDGIARKQVMEAILATRQNPLVIVDNVEYCANWGRLDVTSAKPELIQAYRNAFRSPDWKHYIFEQQEGREGHGAPDATGWESGHRWASSVLWKNSHVLNRLMVTNIGYPLVNLEGEYDKDLDSLGERCPYDWDNKRWVRGRYPVELDMGLPRKFE